MNNVVSISKIGNNLIIKKEEEVEGATEMFVSTKNSIIISISNLATLLRFLVLNNFVSHKVLEGILEEYHLFRGDYKK